MAIQVNIGKVNSSPGTGKRTALAPSMTLKPLSGAFPKRTGGERIDTLRLSRLMISLEERDGNEIISDTFNVSGMSNESLTTAYLDSLPPRTWIIAINSYDERGEKIHEGKGILRTIPDKKIKVVINLIITVRILSSSTN